MANYLALSDDQKKRVKAVLRDDAAISTLKTAEELHYAARSWNWDNGNAALRTIVRRSECSLATALLIYWNGEPIELFMDCSDRGEAEEEFSAGATFDLLLEIEEGVAGGSYCDAGIGYDPTDDDEIDLTEGWDDEELLHEIPEAMVRPVKGAMADPKIAF